MPYRRPPSGAFLVVALLLASCVESGPLDPGDRSETPVTPAAALVDGSTTGSTDFYFLPPLGDPPVIEGTFNPDLLPAVRVCGLDEQHECHLDVAFFDQGSAQLGDERYELVWDTDGPETLPLNPSRAYRLFIEVGGVAVGSVDLNPQEPGQIGPDADGGFEFVIGDEVPVAFWLSTQTLCEGSGYVIECISGAVLDESGGTLFIESQGERLAVFLPEGGLPGPNHPPITVVLERLDPDLFFAAEGVQCLPLFDAPQFGPCFRITTFPELTDPLDSEALVSICIDADALPALKIPEEQEDQLQIVRWATDGSAVLEGLANVPGDCPTPVATLFDVPERGLMRWAAIGANAVARFVGPEPLLAHGDISLGGLTSSFSRFRFALPGQMIAVAGDGVTLPAGGSPDVQAIVQVLDFDGIPVENAWVHFETGDGTLSAEDDSTDADGFAQVTWTVDVSTPGDKTLTASALGLFDGPVPSHEFGFLFTPREITLTTSVCQAGVGAAAVDGVFGPDEWTCAERVPFQANVSGGAVPAFLYWMNDGTDLFLAVQLQQGAVDRTNTLRFDFDDDDDGVHEVGEDAIGYDADLGAFFDEHLPARCANSGQSGCGQPDASLDGAGAVGNDGTWATYELSHPLSSGDPADFDLVRGQRVGLFLTLQVGNGAQGNTQFPDFREFLSILIAGGP